MASANDTPLPSTSPPPEEPKPSPTRANGTSPLFARIASGTVGSLVTALAVTPLDVVKVRQQARFPTPPPSRAARCSECGTFVLNNGLMECVVRKQDVGQYFRGNRAASSAVAADLSSLSVLGILRQIFRTEGLAGIYSGLAPTLVMAVPSTVLYFSAYDEISARLRRRLPADTPDLAVPLLAGPFSRLLASVLTNPLELVRTRRASGLSPRSSLFSEMRAVARNAGGPAGLWSGLAPTLWRDVPFSAVYWVALEGIREDLHRRRRAAWERDPKTAGAAPPPSPGRTAWYAFVSGAGGGLLAAAATTPFDVVKTRVQVGGHGTAVAAECAHGGAVAYGGAAVAVSFSTLGQMRKIAAEEGMRGLWRGNVTRMVKVAPACAIMISCYEVGKHLLLTEDVDR